jgi:hypothetical protein
MYRQDSIASYCYSPNSPLYYHGGKRTLTASSRFNYNFTERQYQTNNKNVSGNELLERPNIKFPNELKYSKTILYSEVRAIKNIDKENEKENIKSFEIIENALKILAKSKRGCLHYENYIEGNWSVITSIWSNRNVLIFYYNYYY